MTHPSGCRCPYCSENQYKPVAIIDPYIQELENENRQKEKTIEKLRGQLQNAANHLQRAANGYDKNGSYAKALADANKVLYETLHK